MSDEWKNGQPGRFLNDEEEDTPVPGPSVPTHFAQPSTGNRQALGGQGPFVQQPPIAFPNPATGQFTAPGSGAFPNPSTGQFTAPGSGAFPNPPTGQFSAPGSGAFRSSPTGQFTAPGSGAFPSSPTGQFTAPGSGAFPNSPTGQFGLGQTPSTPIVRAPSSPGMPVIPSTNIGFSGPGPAQAPVGAGAQPDTRMRLIYGGGGAALGTLVGLLLGILNSGLEQLTFMEGLGVTIQMTLWFMLMFGIACAFKPQRVEFMLKKHGILD